VDGNLVSNIGKGLLAFAAIDRDDTIKDTQKCAEKLLKFRLWDDDDGKKVLPLNFYWPQMKLRLQSGSRMSKTLAAKFSAVCIACASGAIDINDQKSLNLHYWHLRRRETNPIFISLPSH
jgi:hypothetical protein